MDDFVANCGDFAARRRAAVARAKVLAGNGDPRIMIWSLYNLVGPVTQIWRFGSQLLHLLWVLGPYTIISGWAQNEE